MATLLTVSGLLDWDETVLDGLGTCIDFSRLETFPNDMYKYYNGFINSLAKQKVVLECGMLECVYQDPDIFKNAVKLTKKQKKIVFHKAIRYDAGKGEIKMEFRIYASWEWTSEGVLKKYPCLRNFD